MVRHHQQFTILSWLLLLSQVLQVTSLSTCYGGDQNHTAQSAIFTPCNQNTPFTMCLRTQVDSGNNPADIGCLPNGLAQSPDGSGQFWREGCTDPTWKSVYCLNEFDACPIDGNGNAEVTPCSGYGNSSTWCCGGGNTGCCGTNYAITIAATLGVTSTTSSSSSLLPTQSPTSITPSIASATASSSASPTSTTSGGGGTGLSVGAEAGIGVGASLAGLAIVGGIIWFILRSRRRRRREHVDQPPEWGVNTPGGGWGGGGEVYNGKGSQVRHELDGDNRQSLRSEMPVS